MITPLPVDWVDVLACQPVQEADCLVSASRRLRRGAGEQEAQRVVADVVAIQGTNTVNVRVPVLQYVQYVNPVHDNSTSRPSDTVTSLPSCTRYSTYPAATLV